MVIMNLKLEVYSNQNHHLKNNETSCKVYFFFYFFIFVFYSRSQFWKNKLKDHLNIWRKSSTDHFLLRCNFNKSVQKIFWGTKIFVSCIKQVKRDQFTFQVFTIRIRMICIRRCMDGKQRILRRLRRWSIRMGESIRKLHTRILVRLQLLSCQWSELQHRWRLGRHKWHGSRQMGKHRHHRWKRMGIQRIRSFRSWHRSTMAWHQIRHQRISFRRSELHIRCIRCIQVRRWRMGRHHRWSIQRRMGIQHIPS